MRIELVPIQDMTVGIEITTFWDAVHACAAPGSELVFGIGEDLPSGNTGFSVAVFTRASRDCAQASGAVVIFVFVFEVKLSTLLVIVGDGGAVAGDVVQRQASTQYQ
ncbi:hypothetical protein AK812_SmicGene11388 [Symbiodinium microadriaticum]|uniref:Uncharacterized protein n=1 Tax=Symbiodinium microadriaticum TaxID=2951 RepID=A0A1Q9EDB9_SYMMI|nr:hypothetical protein AK812_SmicGene11388 [Symbiodinium microadriaticum]CAE7225202.1 unnamed protein product [Symbiodinium microadriaticum]